MLINNYDLLDFLTVIIFNYLFILGTAPKPKCIKRNQIAPKKSHAAVPSASKHNALHPIELILPLKTVN